MSNALWILRVILTAPVWLLLLLLSWPLSGTRLGRWLLLTAITVGGFPIVE